MRDDSSPRPPASSKRAQAHSSSYAGSLAGRRRHMSGMPARLDALVDVLESSEDASSRTCLRMLERGDGPARLVFKSSGKRRRATRLSRWLAIVCLQPPLERAASVAWVPDGRITCWAAGMPPGELHREVTGLDPGATGAVVARSQQRGWAAPFCGAGRVPSSRNRARRAAACHEKQAAPAGLAAHDCEHADVGPVRRARARRGCPRPPGPRRTITASGAPRPLDTEAMRRWL